MLGVFGALRGVVQVREAVVHVASPWCGLHHRVTAPLLLLLTLLVSARQYLGEPVQCVQHRPGDDAAVPEHVMNTYCFVATTYTVVRPASRGHWRPHWGHVPGIPVHPGLVGLQGLGDDPWHADDSVDPEKVPDHQGASIRRHAYYQWVPLVLLLQAMLFAAPYAGWQQWEGGLVDGALRGLTGPGAELLAPDVRLRRVRALARYFVGTLNHHVVWAAGYWAMELLNLLNVVGNALLTDALLGGRFFSYGVNVLAAAQQSPVSGPAPLHPQLNVDPYPDLLPAELLAGAPPDPNAHPEDPGDPMEAVFPKLTKCTFFKYGASGSIQRHDALCVMALNVVNEKVFILLWFWFAIVALVSVLVVVRSAVTFAAYACIRRRSTRNRLSLWVFRFLLGTPPLHPSLLEPLATKLNCGDWLFLTLLSKNLRSATFRSLAQEVGRQIGDKPARSELHEADEAPAELDRLVEENNRIAITT